MTTPTDMPAIVPHLCVKGGKEAVAFYERAFGAKLAMVMPAEDGQRLMHADLAMFGGHVYLHDEFPEYDSRIMAPPSRGGASLTVNINLGQPAEVDAAIRRAVEAGATSVMEAQDTFWGARYGKVQDPFGHVWSFNAMLPGSPAR